MLWSRVRVLVVASIIGMFLPQNAWAQSEDLNSLNEKASQLFNAGKYSEAIPIANQYSDAIKKKFGESHPNYATALNNLAILYFRMIRYAEAESLYKRSIAIREKALGPDHPGVGMSLNSLARLYEETGRYAEAEPLYKRSLVIREKDPCQCVFDQ